MDHQSTSNFTARLNPLDMPYVCMPEHGTIDRIVDSEGKVLPNNWTGLCVTAVSTKEYWFIRRENGDRHLERVGRFETVAAAIASLQAA